MPHKGELVAKRHAEHTSGAVQSGRHFSDLPSHPASPISILSQSRLLLEHTARHGLAAPPPPFGAHKETSTRQCIEPHISAPVLPDRTAGQAPTDRRHGARWSSKPKCPSLPPSPRKAPGPCEPRSGPCEPRWARLAARAERRDRKSVV